MFKSLKYKSDTFNRKAYIILYVFELLDSDFSSVIDIAVSATDGTESNSIAAAAIIQEYAARKLSVPKNLSCWYIDRLPEYREKIFELMDKDRKYIERYFPSLKCKIHYSDMNKIIEKKLKEFNDTTV
jgi:hypothetical protein